MSGQPSAEEQNLRRQLYLVQLELHQRYKSGADYLSAGVSIWLSIKIYVSLMLMLLVSVGLYQEATSPK